jgi:hypothetical protein
VHFEVVDEDGKSSHQNGSVIVYSMGDAGSLAVFSSLELPVARIFA